VSQPDTIAPEDWLGLPHRRPGLMRPRDYQAQRLAEKARKASPDRLPDAPDVVLARRPIPTLAELVALCNGAKLALGVAKETPAGQLGPGWTWWARHGFGQRGRDGAITESVYLRVARPPRSVMFLWSRPVPDPRLIRALRREIAVTLVAGFLPVRWPVWSALLAALPALEWTSEYVTSWTASPDDHPDDIPRVTPSAAAKKEIRS
jgi:hypothetical protein